MYRTIIIYKLYSPALNKSYISYTTNLQRALWNLKSYEITGTNRSKSGDIIRQGDYETVVLDEVAKDTFSPGDIAKYKNFEDQTILVNPVLVPQSPEERKMCNRQRYHNTLQQLGYYHQNRKEILRAGVLRRMRKTKQLPLEKTLQKYAITQEEVDACLMRN